MAGDGTTTATVLAQALVNEGLKNVRGANPILLKKGIEKATAVAVAKIQEMSRPVETREAIAQVAAISADDPEIGELWPMPWRRWARRRDYGRGSTSTATTLEVVEGLQFDRGTSRPHGDGLRAHGGGPRIRTS